MAKWVVHGKWNSKFGLSKGISIYVNSLIDFPQKNLEFVNYAKAQGKSIMGSSRGNIVDMIAGMAASHDSGRRKDKWEFGLVFQLEFLKKKGEDFIKAWYLHQALDYISEEIYKRGRWAKESIKEEINLGMLERLMKSSSELWEIKGFVLNNFDAIFEDCVPS